MSARILVVDDVEVNVRLLEAKLSAEYFNVLTAPDGQTALRLAHDEHPDVILLDIMMPRMDGFEVCRRLKADPHTADIPVVMVTALSESADRVRGLEAGADDFVTKPIDFDLLESVIGARLAGAARSKRWPIVVDISDREVETLTWAARGKTSAEIAVILGLSKRTVDFHIDNARIKLGATTRIEAAIKAATGRLIQP
jgi:DNA-binding response OmpR family regulator